MLTGGEGRDSMELPHQIRNAWNDINQKPLVRTFYSKYVSFYTLSLSCNRPLKFLSILHQTHSNSLSYWNLNSIYIITGKFKLIRHQCLEK